MDKKTLVMSHLEILKAMTNAYPSITVIDNNREEHTSNKTLNMNNIRAKFEFWTSKNRTPTNQRVICQHRIRTEVPLSELKTAWEVMEKLKKAKAYVGLHKLGEKVKEVAHLGFLLKTHVVHVPKNIAVQRLRQRLKQVRGEVPRFTLVAQNITIGKPSDLNNRARAYDIRCDQKDASRLTKMLQSEPFDKDPVYMPYYMKKSKPQTLTNALRVQNEIHRNTYVIKAQGITMNMMNDWWNNHLAAEPGMMEIVPTQNLGSKGEWRILVHKDHFKNLHSKLTQDVTTWWENLDENMKNQSPHADPKVISRRPFGQQDSDDESLHTYSSMLTNLYDPPSEAGSEEMAPEPFFTQEPNPQQTNQKTPNAANANSSAHSPSPSKVFGSSKVSGITNASGLQSQNAESLETKVEILQDTVNNLTAKIAQLMHILNESRPPDPKRRSLNETPQKVRESKRLFDPANEDDRSNNDSMHEDNNTNEQEIVFALQNTPHWDHDDATL